MKLIELNDGDVHLIVAESKQQALDWWYRDLGDDVGLPRYTDTREVPDGEKISVTIMNPDGEDAVYTKTAAEWIEGKQAKTCIASTVW